MFTADWLSIHIYYYNNSNPLIVQCLKPLVDKLRERGLIVRYFFIKYWLEGPHVRLRLLPAPGVSREALKPWIEPPIQDYLRRRPSLPATDPSKLGVLYRDLFEAEYGPERWKQLYGAQGVMPLRPNNSFAYIDYEPEYARYGGPTGVELAEWHFEYSSEVTIHLIREANVHVHTVLLGLSAQLMLHLCYGLLHDDNLVHKFLEDYCESWQKIPQYKLEKVMKYFKNRNISPNENLSRRTLHIRNAVLFGLADRLTDFERAWSVHIRELRSRIDRLADQQQLRFAASEAAERQDLLVSKEAIIRKLLHGYVHMTNNRLGATIRDELYVAYLLQRCIEDLLLS